MMLSSELRGKGQEFHERPLEGYSFGGVDSFIWSEVSTYEVIVGLLELEID